jgi:MYXO-CTERM domain-containing protein
MEPGACARTQNRSDAMLRTSSWIFRKVSPALIGALGLLARDASADQVIPLDGEVTAGSPDHVLIPFEVPGGTAEIEIIHTGLAPENTLDWGLNDPNGFRGWGGGNSEPAVVGELAASRSYLAGPIPPGTWHVVIGKAQINVSPAPYSLSVVLRDAPTLAPQPERAPYVPSPPLAKEARWYAGDFHVHSMESGDARPPLDEIADFARSRGLDFVEISDHNTTSQLDFFNDAQSRHKDILFLPGVEFTTYAGHANGIGATKWVDHKIGLGGVTIEGAAAAFAEQGAIFSINHPVLDLGAACIGCAWKHELAPSAIGAVEIATGGWAQSGQFFGETAILYWNKLCAQGFHIAAIGGSDDHKAGVDLGGFQSPIGDPTTMVFAEELSAAGILDGIRKGRTVVKLQGIDDPMVELTSSIAPTGDTVLAEKTTLQAKVTGGAGSEVRFVHNGLRQNKVMVASDPFTIELDAPGPPEGEDFWRVEVLVDGKPRTVTSHLWVKFAKGIGAAPPVDADGGCGCSTPGRSISGGLALMVGALGALAGLRRRRRSVP